MAKDEDRNKGNGTGFMAVLLFVCLMIAASFLGDDHPMDQMADIIMILTWVIAIGALILIIFFVLAYAMQTAISDLYESILEDMEHSQFKEKIEESKAFLDKHVFRRPVSEVTEKQEEARANPDENIEESEEKPPQNL